MGCGVGGFGEGLGSGQSEGGGWRLAWWVREELGQLGMKGEGAGQGCVCSD